MKPHKEKCPTPGGHVFQATGTIFELVQDIIGSNVLTNFHDDRTINMASRVLTRKNATSPWRPYIIGTNLVTKFHDDRGPKNALPTDGHVYKATDTMFTLIQDIIWTNLLTKFHVDRKINMASKEKYTAPGGHVFRPTGIIFELFHEDQTINVVSGVKNAPPPGGHVFKATETILKLNQDIIWTNILTKFHEDRKINVTSRVLTRFYYSHIWKNAPPPGGHVFQLNGIIFELVQDIIGMNLLTKKNAPPPGELIQDIFGTNLPSKFHEDQKINVASRVLTRFYYMPCPLAATMNLLTKFHEDQTINVASRVLTRQMLTPHNARRTKGDHKSSP
ncbi:hypothetical protein DPMN_001911 [Dreissena polymorpha]|uniref:Uncharacterized protein n=1 Tax=Dreissena polymorpha TaxID=45954 RepID=A0A9D4MKN4_DREPO|nr:hypothetical protein DPMN_001911 [Dreissena polymorpha]